MGDPSASRIAYALVRLVENGDLADALELINGLSVEELRIALWVQTGRASLLYDLLLGEPLPEGRLPAVAAEHGRPLRQVVDDYLQHQILGEALDECDQA